MIASGDSGPYPRGDCSRFSSAFPSSSPYVTSVGATYKEADSTVE